MALRCLVFAAALSATGAFWSDAGAQPADAARPTHGSPVSVPWAQTVLEHEPGRSDSRIVTVASWSNRDLRTIGIDAGALVQAMRQPSRVAFSTRTDDGHSHHIQYTANQIRRLREMACSLTGMSNPDCKPVKQALDRDSVLARLSDASQLAKGGDDNFLLRRGALLHTDIAMLGLAASAEPISQATPADPQSIRVTIADGRETDMVQSASHWEIARMLLDEVTPPGASKPAPGRDDMVRLWYRATATWMQRDSHLDTTHLDRAREIFADDADIMFLTGSLHENLCLAGDSSGTAIDGASDRNQNCD